MEVILLNDFEGLGKAGDIVRVKSGFARNMLFPQGLALRASRQNIATVEEKKKVIENNKIRENASQDSILEKLSKTEITIEMQVGEEDKMYGSITSNDIQNSLEEKGIIVDRNNILLDSPIKSLGIFHINIRLSDKHQGDIKLYVIKA
tara:strand:+ start:2470 stop:2913 length:444 start_codon:yes stop_codon:yes gene_type:complete